MIAALHQGTTFIYQEFMGLLYGLLFLVFTLTFDSSIHRYCELTGFQLEPSKKYKFYLFFLCLGLFSILLVYYSEECEDWITPKMWLDNTIDQEKVCLELLYHHSQNRIGLDQTFYYSYVLFFLIGMGFGTSYSIEKVDCLEWVHTRPMKRLIRGVLGVGITLLIYGLILLIDPADTASIFMIEHALPSLLFSLFNYGWFPIIC
jgi:hypothetical protein